MNQKKARAARRATRRSIASNSLQKKAEKVERTEARAEFAAELGTVVKARDKALAEAAKQYEDDLLQAKDTYATRKNEAWVEYQKARNALVKKYGEKEAVESGSA